MGTSYNSNFLAKYSAFSPRRLFERESGYQTPVGTGDAIAKSLYCGMKPIAWWDCEHANALPTGGVFNLEFSPDGSLLVAACEKKSIQVFDPLTHQRMHSINGAHSDCVNCVKFLDDRMFATCSDDTTIALWDVRNMSKKIRSLLGHSNWVKNIEFSIKDKLLVTSGLDGSIYTWDINSYSECNLVYQRVFHASGLMRCRLSPDANQMIMCTTGGLLVIVHDLNLSTLAVDLRGFKPNLYRLMQMSKQLIPLAATYDHLFDLKRTENRIEFISDFPDGNDAEVVSALQIHPQGWSALSRNISHDDRSEWTCIHDIQPLDPESDKACMDTSPPDESPSPPPAKRTRRRGWGPRTRSAAASEAQSNSETASSSGPNLSDAETDDEFDVMAVAATRGRMSSVIRGRRRGRNGAVRYRRAAGGEGAAGSRDEPETSGQPSTGVVRGSAGTSSIQNDVWEASITIKQHRMIQEMYSRGQVGRNFNMQRIMGINTGITPPASAPESRRPVPLVRIFPRAASSRLSRSHNDSIAPSTSRSPPSPPSPPPPAPPEDPRTSHFIRQNRDRLLYYVEETNEGKGFIKELCYSADGRLVCSPFGRGMRLLALNDNCAELSQCAPSLTSPARMVEVGQSLGIHQDLVVSAKFSPRHHLLVTGCLEGKIVWYEPYSGEALF